MTETQETMIIDEHEDTDRLTMIFEAQGLDPEAAAAKAAKTMADKEDNFDVDEYA